MRKFILAAAALATVSTAAVAAVDYTPGVGGFVGKGDVQLALGGLNNAQVQALGNPTFTYDATTVTEVSWECTNANNEKVQERERETTTSSTGVVSSVARVKNQITGYNLGGFAGGSTTSSTSTDGPPLNSCPNSAGSWSLTSPAGDATVVSSTGGLFVNGAPLQ